LSSYRAKVTISAEGSLPDFSGFERELRRAQEENAREWEREVRRRAELDMAASKTNPGRTRHSRMAQRYYGRVDAQGNLHGTNPTEQAKWKEFGTNPHPIEAKPGSRRGSRGRFIRGARMLRFPHAGSPGGVAFRRKVRHPGQPARPVMLEAMEDKMPSFIDNIRRAVDRSIR
jgi:hypothetical protein